MPLNIRNPQTDALAAQLAKLTGETKTETVTQALKKRLARIRHTRGKRGLADDLEDIALHCSALPILDACSDEQILDYDELGIPR